MNRSIVKRGKWEATTTRNGVNTWTANVFRTPLKKYTPLENGFNLELANDVYDTISKNPYLWNQASWRDVDVLDPDFGSEQLLANSKMVAFEMELDKPACGTTMCFAGWATELVKVDWVVDAYWFDKINRTQATEMEDPNGTLFDLVNYAEMVLLPNVPGDLVDLDNQMAWTNLPEPLSKRLVARGFTPRTHHLGTVQDAGQEALGIDHDRLGLFSAGNNLDQIRTIIDGYAKYGPKPTKAQVVELSEQAGREICHCDLCQPTAELEVST